MSISIEEESAMSHDVTRGEDKFLLSFQPNIENIAIYLKTK